MLTSQDSNECRASCPLSSLQKENALRPSVLRKPHMSISIIIHNSYLSIKYMQINVPINGNI